MPIIIAGSAEEGSRTAARLVGQAIQMHAVQVQRHIAVRAALGRQEQLARMAGDRFGSPRASAKHDGKSSQKPNDQ